LLTEIELGFEKRLRNVKCKTSPVMTETLLVIPSSHMSFMASWTI